MRQGTQCRRHNRSPQTYSWRNPGAPIPPKGDNIAPATRNSACAHTQKPASRPDRPVTSKSNTAPARTPTITIGLRPHIATQSATQTAALTEDTPPAVRAILATMHALPDGGARFVFELEGDRARLPIPPPSPPDTAGAADELWQHTCFEVFVATPGEEAYREFNFSPSGQWASYAFKGYRERDEDFTPSAVPSIRFAQRTDSLTLEAELPAAALPPVAPGADLRIALSAVIERNDGELEYWAVHHPAAQPDFHHRDGFVLILSTAAAEAA